VKRCIILIILLVLSLTLPSGAMAEGESGVIHLDSVGYLQIQSPVEGARVYLDRSFIGFIQNGACTIPIDVTATPPYSDLILEYTGYQTFVGPVPAITPGKTVSVKVDLSSSGYERLGMVQFESGLPETELMLNGRSMGVTPDSGTMVLQTVPVGLYDFTVKRPGNLTITSQQYVSSNAMTMYRVTLQPATTGEVIVNTTPDGAGIYLDNQYMGLSPLNLPDVAAGNKTLRITRDGYQEWSGELMVSGGVSNPVDVVLVSSPPTPSPDCPTISPATPATGAGIPASPISGDLFVVAGIVLICGLVACAALVIWTIMKKKEE